MITPTPEHYAIVRRIAAGWASKTPRHIEFDDIYQDGCVGLLQAAQRWDGPGEFAPFAIIRIQGAIVDAMRSRKARGYRKIGADIPHESYQDEQVSTEPTPDEQLEMMQQAELLQMRVAKFSPCRRQSFNLRMLGFEYKEMAAMTGFTEGACQVAYSNISRQLLSESA